MYGRVSVRQVAGDIVDLFNALSSDWLEIICPSLARIYERGWSYCTLGFIASRHGRYIV